MRTSAAAARLVIAQAGASAVIGLAFSRGRLSSVLITLMLTAALAGLALLIRSGTQLAWTAAIAAESAFAAFGLVRFITTRYLGGTLLAFIVLGVLLYPAVAAASAGPPPQPGPGYAEPALTEPGQS
ncbi:MAG TPA: hypothetical protein VH637_13195 [Streptosporangiaceae bacterium]|jgi:ribose/xylose/arabinose/galactoside ABC-type transport system permease subunit